MGLLRRLLLLPLLAAPDVTVSPDELPASLLAGDVDANAAAFCEANGFGPTPQGVPCPVALAADLVLRANASMPLGAEEAVSRGRVLRAPPSAQECRGATHGVWGVPTSPPAASARPRRGP